MDLTISPVSTPGADTPMKASAPRMTSPSAPLRLCGFVSFAISSLTGFMPSSRPSQIAPRRSQSVTSTKPAESSRRQMEIAAAPAPEMTTRTSSFCLPTTFSALVMPASVMIAVPCWSSWKMGMSQHSLSLRSISKQRGAEMSSRFTPPKEPEISQIVRTISSTSLLLMQRGKASTPPKLLNSTHLPSMTGMPASGPMSPRPSTAVPSVTTRQRFQRRVSS